MGEDMDLSFEEDVDENPLLSLIQKMVINVLEDLEDDLLKANHKDTRVGQAVENFSFWAKFILKSPLMMEAGAPNLLATEAGQLVSSILTSILANYDLLSHKKEKLPEGIQSPVKEGLVPGNVFQGITSVVKKEEGESNQNQQSASKDQDEGDQENLTEILLDTVVGQKAGSTTDKCDLL